MNHHESPKFISVADTWALGGGEITYYRTDYHRLCYADHWRVALNPLAFLVTVVSRTFRVPLPAVFADAG